ncbi:MAG: hypothetical protein H6581_15890 [Bacteroidia bacterium]|nr:hypothetical protein [Bacteroidia bacterium]
MKKIHLIFGLGLLLLLACKKEVIDLREGTFVRFFGGTQDEIGYAVLPTPEGGILFGGSTTSTNNGKDVIIFKTDSSGIHEWEFTEGSAYDDEVYSLLNLSDGNYLGIGVSHSTGNPYNQGYIVKISAQGSVMDEKFFGTESKANYDFRNGTVLQDGGLLLCGRVVDSLKNEKIYVVRLDEDFNEVWELVDTCGSARDVKQDSDGDFYLLSFGACGGYGGTDTYLQKYDLQKNLIWSKPYGGVQEDRGWTMLLTTDGGIAVAGDSKNKTVAGQERDVWVFKTDLSGNILYENRFGGSESDRAQLSSMAEFSDGSLFVAGDTRSKTNGGSDFFILKVSTESQDSFEIKFGGNGHDIGRGAAITSDGKLLIVGDSESLKGVSRDIVLIKALSNGRLATD